MSLLLVRCFSTRRSSAKIKLHKRIQNEVASREHRRAIRAEREEKILNEEYDPYEPQFPSRPASHFVSKVMATGTHDAEYSKPVNANTLHAAPEESKLMIREDRQIQEIEANKGLSRKMEGIPTDLEYIDFSNAMEYQLETGISGRVPDKNSRFLSKSPFEDEFFKGGRERSLANYGALFWVQSAHGMATHAFASFQGMLKLGINPDEQCYIALISACGKSTPVLLETIVALYHDMCERKITPSVSTFSALINSLGKSKSRVGLETAFTILDEMKKWNIKPNQVVFTSLISSCISHAQYDRAWETYNFMQENFVQPDIYLYTLLLKLCAKSKHPEKALAIYSELLMARIQPNTMMYTALFTALSRRKDMYTKAFEIFDQMKSKGVRPNEYVIFSLLAAAAHECDVDAAIELWKIAEITKLPKYPVLYNGMLNVLAKSQSKESVLTTEYGNLTHGKRISMATNIIAEIVQQKLPLQVDTLNNALICLTAANRAYDAFQFYDSMFSVDSTSNRKIKPTEKTFMALLRMCNALRLLEKAEFVLSQMKVMKIVPSFEVYCIILRLYAELEDREGALPHILAMKKLGYALRSRNIRLSIPTFFTMSEADRKRENVQGEMPYHPDPPAYPTEHREPTYPYTSDMLLPQRDEKLIQMEKKRWEQFEKEFADLNTKNSLKESPVLQLFGESKVSTPELSLNSPQLENQVLEYAYVKSKVAPL